MKIAPDNSIGLDSPVLPTKNSADLCGGSQLTSWVPQTSSEGGGGGGSVPYLLGKFLTETTNWRFFQGFSKSVVYSSNRTWSSPQKVGFIQSRGKCRMDRVAKSRVWWFNRVTLPANMKVYKPRLRNRSVQLTSQFVFSAPLQTLTQQRTKRHRASQTSPHYCQAYPKSATRVHGAMHIFFEKESLLHCGWEGNLLIDHLLQSFAPSRFP